MKTKRATAQDDASYVDMTPMLDIVFIMLIFFIVASSFIKETAIDLNPLTKNSDVDKTIPEVLVIQIDQNNDISIDGQGVDIAQLTARVEHWKIDKKLPKIVINTSELASTAKLVSVADRISLAEIDSVTVTPMP